MKKQQKIQTQIDVFGIDETAATAHKINVANGWWEDRENVNMAHPSGQLHVALGCIALIHTELSEAVEALRKHDPETWTDHTKKDTFIRELAGAKIRIDDLAVWMGGSIGLAMQAELENNATRGIRHGGKRA